MNDYNEHRPHESLGDLSPKKYLEKMKDQRELKEVVYKMFNWALSQNGDLDNMSKEIEGNKAEIGRLINLKWYDKLVRKK